MLERKTRCLLSVCDPRGVLHRGNLPSVVRSWGGSVKTSGRNAAIGPKQSIAGRQWSYSYSIVAGGLWVTS
ncbi:hypothetical protein GCM10028857_25360 [Salinarchaeum chitinilyticum]